MASKDSTWNQVQLNSRFLSQEKTHGLCECEELKHKHNYREISHKTGATFGDLNKSATQNKGPFLCAHCAHCSGPLLLQSSPVQLSWTQLLGGQSGQPLCSVKREGPHIFQSSLEHKSQHDETLLYHLVLCQYHCQLWLPQLESYHAVFNFFSPHNIMSNQTKKMTSHSLILGADDLWNELIMCV